MKTKTLKTGACFFKRILNVLSLSRRDGHKYVIERILPDGETTKLACRCLVCNKRISVTNKATLLASPWVKVGKQLRAERGFFTKVNTGRVSIKKQEL